MANKKDYNKTEKVDVVSFKQKRGNLSPLMSEDEKEKASIHELSYDFDIYCQDDEVKTGV